jgi:hypothetical protein
VLMFASVLLEFLEKVVYFFEIITLLLFFIEEHTALGKLISGKC